MKKVIRCSVMALALAGLVACGDNAGGNGVHIDTSSDSTVNLSVRQMVENMTIEQRQAFERNMLDIRNSVEVDTEGLSSLESRKAFTDALMEIMEGMTASDIADKADDIRNSKG